MADASVVFNILANNETGAAFDEVEGQMDGLVSGAKLLGAAFAATQLFDWGKDIVDAGQTAQSTINSTAQLIATMGTNAGVTASQVQDASDSMGAAAGVVGADMQTALNKALGSTSVEAMFKNGVVSLDQFAQAVSDMSSKATGGKNTVDSLSSAATQLGKAFTDPATGATALKKAGVLLTAAQIASIKATEKQSGVIAAQKELYQDLNGVIAGQTAATVPASAQLTASLKTVEEEIGMKLLPVVKTMSDDLLKVMNFVQAHSTVFGALATGILGIATAFGAWKIISGVKDAWIALDAAMDANPMTVIIVVLIGIAAALVYAYENSKTFRDIVQAALHDVEGFFKTLWNTVKSVFDSVKGAVTDVVNFIKSHWQIILAILTGPFGLFIDAVVTHWNTLKSMFETLIGWIKTAWHAVEPILEEPFKLAWDVIKPVLNQLTTWVDDFKQGMKDLGGVITSVWDGIKSTISGVFHAIVDAFNASGLGSVVSAIGKVASFGGSVAGKVGSFFGFAAGGTVGQGGYAIVGENGPELALLPGGTQVIPNSAATVASRSTSVMALNSRNLPVNYLGSGGGAGMTLMVDGNSNDILVQMLRKYVRLQGGSVQKALGAAA